MSEMGTVRVVYLYQGATQVPYCVVKSIPPLPGVSHFGRPGVSIQRLNEDAEPIGNALLFSDSGALILGRALREVTEIQNNGVELS